MGFVRFIDKLSNLLKKAAEYVSCICMAMVVILLFSQVLMRVFVGTNFPWAEEIARLCMVWVAMLGIGILVREKNLISVDFLDPFFPKWFIKYREVLITILLVWLCSVLAYEGYHQAIFGQTTTMASLTISMFWPYVAVPVGAVLMMYHHFVNTVERFFPLEAEREDA